LTGLVVCSGGPRTKAAAPVDPASNPYQAISGRNVFHSNPPPPLDMNATSDL
jgi:hypothetical protein